MNARTDGSFLYDTPLAEFDGGVGAFVRSWLPAAPARVLEIGCGDGDLAMALSEEGWQVTAVDPAAPEGEPFIRGAIEDLDPSEHGLFDAAVAVLSLHHLDDLGVALDRVRSPLKPGAVFIVDEFSKEELEHEATAAYSYLRAAIASVVDGIFAARSAEIWGEATTACASDSKKFGAWDQNLLTSWSICHRGRGVMIYWHVDRKSACIYSQGRSTKD